MQRVLCLMIFTVLNSVASAKPLWSHHAADDPALSLTVLKGDSEHDQQQLVAGYDSGKVICFGPTSTDMLRPVWTSKLDGSILALKPIADINTDGFAEVVAATDTGTVACICAEGPAAGVVNWSINTVFNISDVVIVNDTNGDGVSEVAFGGADHRVHLIDGSNGKQLWVRLFMLDGDIPFVDCLSNAGDLNGDSVDDIFVRTWAANRWAISGVDGTDIWSPRRGSRFLSTLATAGDANGDGVSECLESGNDGVLILCNGRNGDEIWQTYLGHPIRAITPADNSFRNGSFHCFAGTAEGKVACVAGSTKETVSVRWAGTVGDVCREIVIAGDIDKDGIADVVAGAENGIVSAFSGKTGTPLWQWQGVDVVRAMIGFDDVDADGVGEIAVALLDGTLAVLPGRPAQKTSRQVLSPATAAQHTNAKLARKTRNNSTTHNHAPEATEVPILLYHDVPPARLLPSGADPLANFRDQMDLIVKAGYSAVSLDEIAAWIDGKGSLPPKPVCLTLDGQYASHDTHLFKILKERGLFAISYITTDWIGTSNHLDWHELRRLEKSGVMQIENHSFNHPLLTTISEEEARSQVTVSNKAISKHLNGKVSTHHAFPSGAFNNSVCRIVQEAGFRTATGVMHRRATRSDNLLRLPRYTIAENTSLDTFKAIIGYEPLPYPSLDYTFQDRVGSGWRQPSFGDVDADGKLWVCDYSAHHVRVFLPDGTEAPFSPISEGLNHTGESVAMRAPSGIAVSPNGEVLVSVASRFGSIQHTGLFRYRASDGKCLAGVDLPYYAGDVDTDANGLIYVVEKLTGRWHVHTALGEELPGSPVGPEADMGISRGITVTPDATRVYVIGEMSASVRVWKGNATSEAVRFQETDPLVERLSSQCGGVDVMDDGTVFVSYYDEGMVVAFNSDGKLQGQISGGPTPSLSTPRGVAFTPDGRTVWIISRLSQVQRWQRQ